MRALILVTVLVWSVASLATPALADSEQIYVFLTPDSTGRMLPSMGTAGTSSTVANIDAITPPDFSPTTGEVVFAGAVGDESLGRYALFVAGGNRSNPTQLTQGKSAEFDPSWSPDGSSIVFAQNTTGRLTPSDCCLLALVDVSTGTVTALTGEIGVARPEFSSDGSLITFDTPVGIWRISSSGGNASLVSGGGMDPTFSPDDSELAFLSDSGATMHLNKVNVAGGSPLNLYSTSNQIEQPYWADGRIYFTEFGGLGYDGRRNVSVKSVPASGGPARTEESFGRQVVGATPAFDNDEIFFYRSDGLFRFYEIRPDAALPKALLGGDGYTTGWSSIGSVDLDGDGQDEMFFYREDGLFRYYDIRVNATLPRPMLAGEGYTKDWTSITSVDLDGDGQDEMFFYRDDGLFRYYQIQSDGTLPLPMLAGDNYTTGWSSITSVDLDGDGQDEMFFYRNDGVFRFYEVRPNGTLSSPIKAGNWYETGWTSINAIDLDGDGRDELLFYSDDGRYAYHRVTTSGDLVTPAIQAGEGYTPGWDIITSVNLRPS